MQRWIFIYLFIFENTALEVECEINPSPSLSEEIYSTIWHWQILRKQEDLTRLPDTSLLPSPPGVLMICRAWGHFRASLSVLAK